MNRRGFLGSILALGAAPAIVRADSLMRIIPREMAFDLGVGAYDVVVEVGPSYTNSALSLDEFSVQYLRPAMLAMANRIDRDVWLRAGDRIAIRQPNRYRRAA